MKFPEMVERIARALISVSEYGLNLDPDRIVNDDYDEPSHPAWHDYVEDAIKAFEATREPTEAMRKAGANVRIPAGYEYADHDESTATEVWQAMHDTALKE
jgi:hypothetical protein